MNLEPRQREDYSDRQIAAARRVLVDLGQVLRSSKIASWWLAAGCQTF